MSRIRFVCSTLVLLIVIGVLVYLITLPDNTYGLDVGDTAKDFTLKDIRGSEYTLSQLLAQKPVVLVFVSFAWGDFRQQVADTELLSKKYEQDIQFVIVYATKTHVGGFADTTTYEEKVGAAIGFVEQYDINIPVLVEETDVSVWRTYGLRPNNAFLIGSDGIIVTEQNWYDVNKMEQAIIKHLSIHG